MAIEPYYEDEHLTLYLGDSREVLDSLAAPVDSLVTDPPYAVSRKGEMLGFVSPNWNEKATHSRGYADHCPSTFRELLEPVFRLATGALKAGGTAISYCGNRTYHQMATIMEEVGLEPLDILVFSHNTGVAKSPTTLAPRHELAALMRKPGPKRRLNPDWRLGNRYDLGKPRKMESAHLTTKPMAWIEKCIEIASDPGDVVLDPFAGSGTTLIAARTLGRKAIGIERDEGWCEVAASRLSSDEWVVTA